ncbi:unnamed protein product (macronuclear) [Paramecium tetraurelia]|uniref:RNB domain-containing protein n=1 Tax=Paramecium tetraurelia TaxID=5888 RepID=A0BFS1_PARTE|nr:uncharacterized protein GSPATT00028423001 [Paramecium tetraurelia]CAK57388.1 unnamed protein product [Paramecium tetraurelia]|eukprot:XP_001424786.1 hypothetical protein (macronuclear) [Paramecium tetraurelia strain d4-2]
MNWEGGFYKQQVQEIKEEPNKRDNVRRDYNQQSQNLRDQQANQGYTNYNTDKYEDSEQKQTEYYRQQNYDQQQNYNQKQRQYKQQYQNSREQGQLQQQSHQQTNDFQERKSNRKYSQNNQGYSNWQQGPNQGFQNPQRKNSNDNDQPFCYPYIEGKEKNTNQEANVDNNNNHEERRNNYSQQEKRSQNYYQYREPPHHSQVRKDRRGENYSSTLNQSEQNQKYNKRKFNLQRNNNNDQNRSDNNNSFEDHYYKKDQGNQRQKYRRRSSDDYGLNEYGIYDDDNYDDRRFKNKGAKGNNNKTKSKYQNFEEYWTEQQIEKGKAENEIFEGIFMASEFTREKSAIKCPIFKKKVHINSFVDTNRAFHGSLVAFTITKISKQQEESENDLEEDVISEQIPIHNNISVEQQKEVKQVNDEKEEQNDDIDNQEDNIDDNVSEVSDIYVVKKKVSITSIQKLQKASLTGKIVGIRKNPFEQRHLVGRICFDEKHEQQDKQVTNKEELINYMQQNYHVSFKCVNKRIPFFNVKELLTFNYELDNEEPVQKFMDYVSQRYFSAKYLQWPRNKKYPTVELIKEVGVQGNIDVECEVILTANSVYENDFSEMCKEELKAFTHDSIAKERVNRMDLTKEYICSIDPVTARDLDDALSINNLGNGIYEIGVHIADVSHFVIPNSEVDKEAILRTTSVYLVHKVIPMLPRILCEELCSLNRDVERLAFSVFFKITSEGEVLWDSFRAAKSVIRSCAQLSYDIVNQIIDGEIEQFSQGEERYNVAEGFDEKILKDKVLLLNNIAQKRREKRLEGSITFEKSKLRFILNADLFPTGYTEEKRGLAQFMVEEWMLLANQFVGKKLIEYDTKTAVLRQHISPRAEKLEYYQNLLEACGLEEMAKNLDVSTSKNLKLTMAKVSEIESEEIKLILGFRLLKLMEAAQYFVVDNTPEIEWRHYALDFDVYTHFTSPIRRYPDVLVHRRLQIALEQQEVDQTGETKDKLKAIMQHCNDCKLNSRRVSDQCDQLFLALLLKANPVEVDGYILSVTKQHIEIIIPKFNLERRVELKNLKNTYKFTVQDVGAKKQELIVFYNDPEDEKGVRLYFVKQFQLVNIKLSGTDTFPIDYQLQIIINKKVLI